MWLQHALPAGCTFTLQKRPLQSSRQLLSHRPPGHAQHQRGDSAEGILSAEPWSADQTVESTEQQISDVEGGRRETACLLSSEGLTYSTSYSRREAITGLAVLAAAACMPSASRAALVDEDAAERVFRSTGD